MNTTKNRVSASRALAAAPGLLLASLALPAAARAADDNADVLALTQPANYVEIGARNVSADSAKFGEYNGLYNSGVDVIANFSLRGGDAYQSHAGGQGTTRWEVRGTDLGTTSRSLRGSVSDQGSWNFGVGYDELRHYSTDSYQTPYQGALGDNVFRLPATFGDIAADRYGDPFTGAQGLTAGQKGAFQSRDVYVNRKNLSLTAGYLINRQWSLQFDYNRLDQTGGKLLAASFSPDASGAGAGENSATFMTPTRYKTDTFDFALNWAGDKGNVRAGYFVSLFHDDYTSFSFSNPFTDPADTANGDLPAGGVFPVNVYGTAPSNSFHQLNLSGGYAFTTATSLAGGLSYGRSTQNSTFIDDLLQNAALPRASLDGLVVNTHADLKLTHQATPKLVLSAGVKYNKRDNQTEANTYGPFTSVAGDTFGTVVSAPVSNKKTQAELAGNYRFDRRQSARLAYEYEAVSRWCNSALANNAQSTDPEGFPPGYYVKAACVQVPDNKDNRFVASYRLRAGERLHLNAAYTHSRRTADINVSYYNPMQASGEGFQNYGFVGYFDAARTEQIVRAGLTWEPVDALSLGAAIRYLDDKYDSTLGVQSGRTEALDLDASYSPAENVSLSAYVTLQQRKRDLLAAEERAATAPPTQIWSNHLSDDNDTVGLTAKRGGLMHGKLQVIGDASYSAGKSQYTTTILNYVSATCGPGVDISCGEIPAIKNDLLRVRLTFTYQTTRTGSFALGYLYQKLTSNDYYYSAYQFGQSATTVLPTNQREPGYSLSVVGLSYLYTFR